jgi:hypothetical protein
LRARDAREHGVLLLQDLEQEWLYCQFTWAIAQETAKDSRLRQRCGAKTRKGLPCRQLSEPGKRRCRFHGGLSTGPKNDEGRQRIAMAQRQRWSEWREQKQRP